MTEHIFTNNAKSTLAQSIGGADTSFRVATGGGALFPAPTSGQDFHVILQEGSAREWMVVTVRSGDNFSGITRSGSQSFAAGSVVMHALNADVLNDFLQKGVYRTYDGSPNGVLAAAYSGEEVLDTTNTTWYKHTTGTEWKAMTN
jgi:hypothetical protein